MSSRNDDEPASNGGSVLEAALYRILTALARVCLRRGVPYEALAEQAKRAFVEVAHREFTIPGRKQSASRVSVLTGIHRKTVVRVLDSAGPDDRAASSRVTCAAAVITGWRRDKRFANGRGRPAALRFDGGAASFSELVRRYGRGDTPARAVLDELTRVGAVSRLRDGRLNLLATAYVPETTSPEALAILGTDVSDLVSTIDHNLSSDPAETYLQRKVAYDNLPAEAMARIRTTIDREGNGLLVKLDRAIAKYDRDASPRASGTGRRRAMIGVYYFEDETSED